METLLEKARVKGHYRLVNGRRVWVPAYVTKRPEARPGRRSAPATPPQVAAGQEYEETWREENGGGTGIPRWFGQRFKVTGVEGETAKIRRTHGYVHGEGWKATPWSAYWTDDERPVSEVAKLHLRHDPNASPFAAVANVETVHDVPESAALVTDEAEIAETLRDIGSRYTVHDFGCLFVDIGEGEYNAVWGCERSVPYLDEPVEVLYPPEAVREVAQRYRNETREREMRRSLAKSLAEEYEAEPDDDPFADISLTDAQALDKARVKGHYRTVGGRKVWVQEHQTKRPAAQAAAPQPAAQPAREWTVADIKAANKRKGGHFFDPSSMRFFSSRIGKKVYSGPGGVFFTTSEQFDAGSPRLYTVREFVPETGDVDTVGEFNELSEKEATIIAAEAALHGRNYAREDAQKEAALQRLRDMQKPAAAAQPAAAPAAPRGGGVRGLSRPGPNQTVVHLAGGGDILFSYETPVAARIGGEVFVAEKVYSQTTSKHIRDFLSLDVATAEKIPEERFAQLAGGGAGNLQVRALGANETQVSFGPDTQVLFSYEVPVAARIGGQYYRVGKKYSPTTSTHVNKWLAGHQAEEVAEDWFADILGGAETAKSLHPYTPDLTWEELLEKAQVKGHYRLDKKTGKRVYVKPHADTRSKKPAAAPAAEEAHYTYDNPPTPAQAKKMLAAFLDEHGLPYSGFKAKSVGFEGRAVRLFVTVMGWKPQPTQAVEDFAHAHGFYAQFNTTGALGYTATSN